MITYIIVPYTHKIKRDKELTTRHTEFNEYIARLKYLLEQSYLMGVEIRILNNETFETHTAYVNNEGLKRSINYIKHI